MSVYDSYSCEGQISMFDLFDLDTSFGKTSQAHSVQTKGTTSDVCLKKFAGLRIKPPQFLCLKRENGQIADLSWVTGGALVGEYTTHSFGEFPNVAVVSRLSQILEANPSQKYCLSATACRGILNRAYRRGKNLPEILEKALIKQSAFKNEQDALGGGKGILIQNEKTCSIRTQQNQSVCVTEPIVLESNQNKAEISQTGICNTIPASAGMGGGYVPMITIEGNGSRDSHKGDGYKESETMYTLNTVEQHAVCIGNGQVNDAMTPSIEVSKSLNCMVDPMKVVCIGNGQTAQTKMSDKVGALNCMHDQQAVMVYGLDRASFNQGQNAKFDFSVEEELSPTLVNRGPGGGTNETVGALCARDYKGVGNQYVSEGKVIVQKNGTPAE